MAKFERRKKVDWENFRDALNEILNRYEADPGVRVLVEDIDRLVDDVSQGVWK